METFEPVKNLLEDVGSLFLREPFVFVEAGLDIAFITELSHDKDMFIRHERINMFDDIFVVGGFKDVNFGLYEFFEFWFFLHLCNRYCFDGYSLLID